MNKIFNQRLTGILLVLSFIFALQGCQKTTGPNPVLNYLNNSQLKFDNKIQRDNLLDAMMDILTLDKKDLEERKYKDLEGNTDKWDLKNVIENHFIPNKPGLTLGNNFYEDVKSDSVMIFIGKLYVRY